MNINYIAPKTVGDLMHSTAFVQDHRRPGRLGQDHRHDHGDARRCALQRKGPDGIRRTRWAIVRQTLQQLKMTVLLDIMYWLRPIATYKVSESLITISSATSCPNGT